MQAVTDRINQLRQEKNAIILAHYYQNSDVQDIADFVGDSFELSRKAREVKEDVIVFCGVHFMAESAKILSPDKTVLLPARDAGCPMADMVDPEAVLALRAAHPNAAVVCYVNTSAAVKAVCDVACTSSNAVQIVSSLPQDEVIFVPDCHLGQFVADRVPNKKLILHPGYCITHHRVKPEELQAARNAFPNAEVLVHPECSAEVVAAADFAGSTAQILNYAAESDKKNFIIGTEQGILHQLKKRNPDKNFYMLSPRLICANMKKTTLQDVLYALENNYYEINLTPEIIQQASKCLDRMLELVAGKK